MRCRKHQSDLSSSVGVCSSCLRDRLFTLIAAQAAAEQRSKRFSAADEDGEPPPLTFPRSVSPYGNSRNRNHQLFFSTPQMRPNSSAASSFVTTGSFDRKPRSKFSFWKRLFRSRSEKFEKNHKIPSRDSVSSSPSWLSIFTPRRNKQSSHGAVEEPTPVVERRHCGMSPARISDSDGECGVRDDSQKLQQSPIAAKRGRSGHKLNASGFAFRLSPLVRASPNPNWSHGQKGLPPEVTYSGDLRVSMKPHLCVNRSKKIADFGRVNHNR